MSNKEEKSAFFSDVEIKTLKNEINSNVDEVISNVASRQDRKEAESKKKSATKAESSDKGLCRFCLEVKITVRALAKHVLTKHTA